MRRFALLLALLLAACGDDNQHGGTMPTPTPPAVRGTLAVEGDTLVFRTAAAALRIEQSPLRLTLTDSSGRVVASQGPSGLSFLAGGGAVASGDVSTYALTENDGGAGRTRTLELSVTTASGDGHVRLQWLSDRTLRVAFAAPDGIAPSHYADAWTLAPGEAIYGLTERLTDSRPLTNVPGFPPIDEIAPRAVGSLDRRGEAIRMLVQATMAVYAPFHTSSNGYGLFVAGTTPGDYDVGRTDPARLSFRFAAAATQPGLTYLLFAGTPAQVLDEYTAQTGRPFIPPAWAFKHWRWRDEHTIRPAVEVDGEAINADVAEDLLMYEALGIPAGVYLIDRPWAGGAFGFDDFQWDPLRFPNPEGMMRVLQARGYRTAVWSAALASGTTPGSNGAEARAAGWLAPGLSRWPDTPEAQVIDLTNPDARAWWIDKHVAFARRWDISAIKLDRGEEYVSAEPTDVFTDGRSGLEVRNEFPVLNLHTYHDALRAARGDGDFVVAARAAYAGAQQWGIVWGGDSPGSTALGSGPGTDLGLRGAIIMQQRAAFLGFPFWGSDTGGYYQFKQRDVFARWLQFSAFCPLMEIGGKGSHAPWNMPTEPAYDAEMIAIYRRYVQLHHDLIPYTRRHADEAARSGLPIARPLVFAWPDDANVRDRWDEYLYGDDLLVAPLWQNGARARDVYLPAGDWEDFWDRSRTFTGPLTITVDAPLDVIPVFVRAGAAVPGRPD